MAEGTISKVLPEDRYNSLLVSKVAPPGWRNPDPRPSYNLVVIGAGTAGLVTAVGAAGLGARVALIEKHLLGGDCLNVGCVPSKCLIRSSRAVREIYTAKRFGVGTSGAVTVDFPQVMARMRRLRSEISSHDSAQRMQELGIDLFFGAAQFTGTGRIAVAGKVLAFRKAVIATGARAAVPPIKGLAQIGYLTNETVFSLTERPRRLAVIGGGPLGCELAQAFQRLGSEVALFHKAPHLLVREDPDAAEILRRAMEQDGVRLLLHTQPIEVTRTGREKIVSFLHKEKRGSVAVDEILLAAGRAPNVAGLNLEKAGVEYDERTGVVVDDRLRTTNPDIFAAGDVCLQHKFTHMADAAARMVIQNALFGGRKRLSTLSVPWVTYTDPEIAHVGLGAKDAAARGIAIDTRHQSLATVDRALTDDETEGFVKIHLKKGTDTILGATIVARHAGEMINEINLAIVAGAGLKTIAQVIHPYPTQAEAIRHIADAYNRTRLTPTIKKLLALWMALNRTGEASAAGHWAARVGQWANAVRRRFTGRNQHQI